MRIYDAFFLSKNIEKKIQNMLLPLLYTTVFVTHRP